MNPFEEDWTEFKEGKTKDCGQLTWSICSQIVTTSPEVELSMELGLQVGFRSSELEQSEIPCQKSGLWQWLCLWNWEPCIAQHAGRQLGAYGASRSKGEEENLPEDCYYKPTKILTSGLTLQFHLFNKIVLPLVEPWMSVLEKSEQCLHF